MKLFPVSARSKA